MPKLVEIPLLFECKIRKSVSIVKGVEYLETCCKFKTHVPPQPPFILFKSGGVIVPSYEFIIGGERVLEKVLQLIEKQKEFDPEEEWIIKLHKNTINAVNTFATSLEM